MIDIQEIISKLKTLPVCWDGKKCIIELKENFDSNWKQMEWIGWYFQYWCQRYLKMDIGTKFGRCQFDGCYKGIDFDFKAHPIYNKNGKETTDLIVNDTEGIISSIQKNGSIGLIVVFGECAFDMDGSFKRWHDELKGKCSEFETIRIKEGRPSRMRKTSFLAKKVHIYFLTEDSLEDVKKFQAGMRNSNGRPRREKILLDVSKTMPDYIVLLDP